MEQLHNSANIDENVIKVLITNLADRQTSLQEQSNKNSSAITKIEKADINTNNNIKELRKDIRLLQDDISKNNINIVKRLDNIDNNFATYKKEQQKKEKELRKDNETQKRTIKNTFLSALINTAIPVLLGFLGAGILTYFK